MRSKDSFYEQQGYLTFAINNSTNYLELAYLQACSIKNTQKINKFAVVVDADTKKIINDKHKKVFDYILELENMDPWPMNNEWQAWMLTPFKETIKLESDIIVPINIDHWWTGLRHKEICLTTKIRNYEGAVSRCRSYRKLFDDNNLPDIYTGIYYFRYSKASLDFFSLVRAIVSNWNYFRDTLLKNCREELPSTDVVFAIAARLYGVVNCTIPTLDYPSFVHMKGAVNGLGVEDKWNEIWNYDFDKKGLTINFSKQKWPVHYYVKDAISERDRTKFINSVTDF